MSETETIESLYATKPKTLSDYLRLAAELCDSLGWDQGITWSGTGEIGFHAHTGEAFMYLTEALRPCGVRSVYVQRGEDYECARVEHTLPTGLQATIYGPHRKINPGPAS
jgi:hypothetical protein